eukprot:3434374-Prymnesium_polylepis.2
MLWAQGARPQAQHLAATLGELGRQLVERAAPHNGSCVVFAQQQPAAALCVHSMQLVEAGTRLELVDIHCHTVGLARGRSWPQAARRRIHLAKRCETHMCAGHI